MPGAVSGAAGTPTPGPSLPVPFSPGMGPAPLAAHLISGFTNPAEMESKRIKMWGKKII